MARKPGSKEGRSVNAVLTDPAERFGLPMPFGWFAVARSEELATGEVKPIVLADEEFVLWRGEDGEVRGIDAYCRHLGAHLGYESRVIGNDLRCPFHHWMWKGDGGVASIPYQEKVPLKLSKACDRSLPIHEDMGIVFAWWHPQRVKPLFAMSRVEEVSEQGWIEADYREWIFDVHVQEITENGADVAHFPALHNFPSPPVPEFKVDGYFRYSSASSKMPTARGMVEGKIDVRAIGPGISFTRFWGITDMLMLQMQTPLNAWQTALRHIYFHPADLEDSKVNVTRKLIRNTAIQLEEDAKVWPHKRHLEKPLLVKNDGPILEYRRFYSRFYAQAE
ncbi:MAG: Rieske 2Fe-2S domain-containing protein [Novosphingobium sp.]|nr:Rieske 2Fe-2S domain-containing protein [Novosphingobium sp.]